MRDAVAVVVGSLGVGAAALAAPALGVPLPLALLGTAVAGFVAGWIAERRGAAVAFASSLIVAALWSAFVMLRAWSDGSLARTSPDCDPCGVAGHAVRMAIVSGLGLATFGVAAAFAGWAGEFVRRRARR